MRYCCCCAAAAAFLVYIFTQPRYILKRSEEKRRGKKMNCIEWFSTWFRNYCLLVFSLSWFFYLALILLLCFYFKTFDHFRSLPCSHSQFLWLFFINCTGFDLWWWWCWCCCSGWICCCCYQLCWVSCSFHSVVVQTNEYEKCLKCIRIARTHSIFCVDTRCLAHILFYKNMVYNAIESDRDGARMQMKPNQRTGIREGQTITLSANPTNLWVSVHWQCTVIRRTSARTRTIKQQGEFDCVCACVRAYVYKVSTLQSTTKCYAYARFVGILFLFISPLHFNSSLSIHSFYTFSLIPFVYLCIYIYANVMYIFTLFTIRFFLFVFRSPFRIPCTNV